MTFLARASRSLKVRIIVLGIAVFVAIYLFAIYVARDFIDSSNYEVAKQLVSPRAHPVVFRSRPEVD
jgi:hypothetical protein